VLQVSLSRISGSRHCPWQAIDLKLQDLTLNWKSGPSTFWKELCTSVSSRSMTNVFLPLVLFSNDIRYPHALHLRRDFKTFLHWRNHWVWCPMKRKYKNNNPHSLFKSKAFAKGIYEKFEERSLRFLDCWLIANRYICSIPINSVTFLITQEQMLLSDCWPYFDKNIYLLNSVKPLDERN
jgi:hypothetical protein